MPFDIPGLTNQNVCAPAATKRASQGLHPLSALSPHDLHRAQQNHGHARQDATGYTRTARLGNLRIRLAGIGLLGTGVNNGNVGKVASGSPS